jgi:hypothetical protein
MHARTLLGLGLAALFVAIVDGCSAGSGASVGGGEPADTAAAPPSDNGATGDDAGVAAGDSGSARVPPACANDELRGAKTGAAQWQALCARGHQDPIAKAFCASSTPPQITSITDLQKLVGLDFKPGVVGNGLNGNPGFAMTTHSTSLVTRHTTVINPRALVFTAPLGSGRQTAPFKPNPSYVAMGFVRGEQFIELLGKDPASGQPRFFLLKYEQACNAAPGGCTVGELLTPRVESNFTSWSLYDETDVKDTVVDCLQCHQPGGPGTPKILRMQELQFPWIHWLFGEPEGNVYLRQDFHAAHGRSEPYAGIPANLIDQAAPPVLEGFVEGNGFIAQPNEMQTKTIMNEILYGEPAQPATNVPPGVSATWQGQYAKSKAAQFIPVPYHDFKLTDPQKLAKMTSAYQSFIAGTTDAVALPDIRDVFLDQGLADMTFRPAAGLDGHAILVQMCQQCHNSKLDQTITRARFNVETLATQMSRQEKDEAIRRVQLPASDCDHMPPARFRELSAQDTQLVVQELQK